MGAQHDSNEQLLISRLVCRPCDSVDRARAWRSVTTLLSENPCTLANALEGGLAKGRGRAFSPDSIQRYDGGLRRMITLVGRGQHATQSAVQAGERLAYEQAPTRTRVRHQTDKRALLRRLDCC